MVAASGMYLYRTVASTGGSFYDGRFSDFGCVTCFVWFCLGFCREFDERLIGLAKGLMSEVKLRITEGFCTECLP